MKRWMMVLLVGGFLVSCGRGTEPKEQRRDHMAIPEFPTFGRNLLELDGDGDKRTFFGSFVIFAPNPKVDRVREAMEAVTDFRLARARKQAIVNEVAPAYDRELARLSETRDAKARELADFSSASLRAGRDAVGDGAAVELAALWFYEANEKTAADAGDRDHNVSVFHAYCEAAIWDLATSQLLTDLRFLARPTPLALCEDYYQSRFFAADEPACQPAEAEKGKDYFDCIWRHGVLETTWFREGVVAPAQRANIERWLADDAASLRQALAKDARGASIVRDHILKLKALPRRMLRRTGIAGERAELFAGRMEERRSAKFRAADWSPSELLSFPLGGSEIGFRPTEDTSLAKALGYFGGRDGIAGSSLSDVSFFRVAGAAEMPEPAHPGLSEDEIRMLGKKFSGLTASRSREDEAAIDALEKVLGDIDFRIAETKREHRRHVAEFDRDLVASSKRVARAANLPGLGLAFLGWEQLVLERNGDALRASVKFGNPPGVGAHGTGLSAVDDAALWWQGCIDLKTDGQVSCEGRSATVPAGAEVRELKALTWSRATGAIDLELELDEPERAGFYAMARASNEGQWDRFCDLDGEAMKGLNLKAKLFPNRLEDAVAILTGDLKFLRDGRVLHDGYVSLDDATVGFGEE